MPPFRINIPPLTRLLLLLLVGLSLIYQAINFRHANAPSARGWIVLIPGVSIFYPWVYASSALAEENVLTMLVGGATIFYGGKYLERAWGSADFAKFMAIVTLIPLVISGILYEIAWTTSGFAPLGYDRVTTRENRLTNRIDAPVFKARSQYKQHSSLLSSNWSPSTPSPSFAAWLKSG
jgi:Eukaryotic integral membrane protein (DUF1751)